MGDGDGTLRSVERREGSDVVVSMWKDTGAIIQEETS